MERATKRQQENNRKRRLREEEWGGPQASPNLSSAYWEHVEISISDALAQAGGHMDAFNVEFSFTPLRRHYLNQVPREAPNSHHSD